LVNIGLLGGSSAEINLGAVLGKSLRIIGTRLRSRPLAQKIEITRMFADRFWPMLDAGELEPIIDSVFKIEDADTAHDYVKQNKNTGKVILEVGTPG
jgi:NADPH:quinone reductase-like Zn-dependent oxidoreductase